VRIAFVIIAAIAMLETAAFAQPRAEDLYAEGQAAYDRADYATAVAKWQASYDLSKESGLLFNLAQAKRLSGDCLGALATYRRFIAADADPASEQHKLAEDLARELEGKCPEPVAPPPKIVDRPKLDDGLNLAADRNGRKFDRTRPGRTWKIAGLATGGVGIVTIAIGLGLGHHGASIGDEVTAACQPACDWAALKDKDARGRREVTIGKALDVVGVAAIAGGAIFYYLGVRQDALAITPTPRDGGAVISWIGSW
jgi:tetratricopeptide (TPR) repeat protein